MSADDQRPAEAPMCWYSPSLGFLVPDPLSDDGQGAIRVANRYVVSSLPDDAVRLEPADRLRAELAETRAALDAARLDFYAVMRAADDVLAVHPSRDRAPGRSVYDALRATVAEYRGAGRSVRGDAPTAGGLLPDKRILIDLTPPSRAIPADQRRKLAAELRSRFVDGPVDEWSAGWLSAAGYIGSDSPIGTDAGTDLAAPAVAPTEPPAVGLPVTLSSPDDVAAIEPDGFVDGATTRGDDVRIPVWRFESGVQLDGAASVTAWVEGVAADGDLSSGPTVDAIEADARRLLAAVAWHRRVAAIEAARGGSR